MPLLARPGRPRRFFDWLAPRYDWINARIYRPEWLRKVRENIRGERVLDVGVGTGFTTGHLDAAVGMDISREMIMRARYRGERILADFARPPFRGPTFDTIVFAGSFYYMPDPQGAMRAAASLLRDGGRVLLLSPATPLLAPFVPIYTEEEYREFMEGAELRFASYERLGWAAAFVMGERP